MGIISFVCLSKTITNDYLCLKYECKDRGSSNNVFFLNLKCSLSTSAVSALNIKIPKFAFIQILSSWPLDFLKFFVTESGIILT